MTTPSPVAFCANCGSHLEVGAHYCGVCGHAVAPPAPGASTVPATQPTVPVAQPAAQPAVPPGAVPPSPAVPYVPYVASTPAHTGPSTLILVLGGLASVALIAAVVALVYAVRSRGSSTEPPLAVVTTTRPTSATAPVSTTTSTTATTVPTTAATTTAPAPPPTVATTTWMPPDTFVWPDMSADAIRAVQGTIAACGQGGWVGDYRATAVADGIYQVQAAVMFEGDDQAFPAAWAVDFTTNRTDVRPLDAGAAALICKS